MNNDLKTARIWCAIFIVLIIAAQIVVFLTPDTNSFLKVGTLLSTVALISALVYAMTSFGKKGAKFFMIYMLLFSLAEIPMLISQIMAMVDRVSGSAVQLLFTAVTVILLIILALMKDLGRKVSFSIVTVILIINLISAVISIAGTAISGAVIGLPVAIIHCGQTILLATVAYLLVQAKYTDKEERGTT